MAPSCPHPSHAPPKSSWSLWGVQLAWGPSSSPAATAPGRWSWGGSRTSCSSRWSRCPCRITIPVQSFSNLQIRGEAVPQAWAGGPGWWHKQGWLLGALWQEKSPLPSLPHSEDSGGFSLSLREPGLLGAPVVGGGGGHGHIPKAEHVPKADDVPNADHIIISSMTTTSPRPTVFLSDSCVPKDNPVPELNHIPKPPMSPWSITSLRPEMSPTVPTAQL